MPPRLDEQLVADVLTGMPGWTGDASRIRRTVRLPADNGERLLVKVAATADAMNHHPVIERVDDEITFEVWTHSEGGVTELDLTLAARIDDLVDEALGQQ